MSMTGWNKYGLYFDTLMLTLDQRRELVRLYGADHILTGTDYPFDMGGVDPVGHVCGAGFDAETTAASCGGNVNRLLAL